MRSVLIRPLGALVLGLLLAAPAAALAAPADQVTRGLHLYGRYCASCHGPNGSGVELAPAGAGPARDQKPQTGAGPPLAGVGARAAHFYLSTGYMPLRSVDDQPRRSRLLLGPRERDALIAYVASLGTGPPVPQPQPENGNLSDGQLLFSRNCAGCHQVVGEGGFVTGAVPPPLEDATAVQIAEAVRIGPYVMPVFTEKQLSDGDLDSIIRYVQWAKHPDDRGGWALGHIGPVPEGLVTWFLAATVLVAVCLVLGKRLRD